MKIIANKFFIIIICLFGVLDVYSTPTPPSPTGKSAVGGAPPPPPGMPIDENIFGLIIIAILFGIYIIYRYQLKVKTPLG